MRALALSSKKLADDTVMTPAEVAEWLQVKPRQVPRLGIPCLDLGPKTKRYLKADVMAWLIGQRRSA
jgi:hypothetical protein